MKIDLLTIWTNDLDRMKKFYRDVLSFDIIEELENYIEFSNDGVRLAICKR